MANPHADPFAPDVIALDGRFGPLSGLVTRLSALPVDKLLIYLVDQVDARLLPELGRQFSLSGLEGWNLARTDDERRALIRRSIALHRKKGTPWALREACKAAGFAVDIVEQVDQRRRYAMLEPVRLNGTWRLGPQGVRLRALDILTNMPQLQSWAQFLVRINLADFTLAEHMAALRAVVDEWRPVSRQPVWLLWLLLFARHTIEARASLSVQITSTRLHPWGNLSLSGYADAGWRLGADGAGVRLPAPFGFALGRVHGVIAGPKLAATRVRHGVRVRLATAAGLVPSLQTLAAEPVPFVRPPHRLFWAHRRLGGGWRLASARLNGGWRVGAAGARLWGQRMHECRRLNGGWRLSSTEPVRAPAGLHLSGLWRLGAARSAQISIRRVL